MRVAVYFGWRDMGQMRVEAGKLRFPGVADSPGIYRLDLAQAVYIGARLTDSAGGLGTTARQAPASRPTFA